MKYLFIAEKPSLMRDVQACYRNHTNEIKQAVGEIDFVALSGHVCTMYSPDDYAEWADVRWDQVNYPMIPSKWGIKEIDDKGKKKTIAHIKSIVNQYDGIIVGTDSDVEGYGIYYLLENKLGIQKKKALRFMEHSLTDGEILKSLLSMTDYHTDPVHQRFTKSFLLRSNSDWLFGMNATRLMSIRQDRLMTIGRVKAPTIKLVYDNSIAIEEFSTKKYYTLDANYGEFCATYVDEKNQPVHFSDINEVGIPEKQGVVIKKQTQQSKTHAPQLYDLTALQSDAGHQFGYSPTQTLMYVQSLYEKHKIVSYPRTQCRFVSTEKAKEFPHMLSIMSVFPELTPYISVLKPNMSAILSDKKIVNDKEVEKESHDALLPTSKRPDLSVLSVEERNVCLLIYKRLLAQFLPQLIEDKTILIIRHDDKNFLARGKVVIEQGWRKLYQNTKEIYLPSLSEGDEIQAKAFKKTERKTKPPRRLTQTTLNDAMKNIANLIQNKELKKILSESKGIGTAATRAGIIQDIITRGYVADRKDGLYITNAGKLYVQSLGDIDIISPVFAALLDKDIRSVQTGELPYETVYQNMLKKLNKMCNDIQSAAKAEQVTHAQCPRCGEYFLNQRFYYHCPNCELELPKKICGVPVYEDLLLKLLKGEVSDEFTFTKKDKSTFTGRLMLKEMTVQETGEITYSISFAPASGITCPRCQQNYVSINRGGAFCECGLKIFRNMINHQFDDKELKKLLEGKQLTNVDFVKKDGTPFTANIELNIEEGQVQFCKK